MPLAGPSRTRRTRLPGLLALLVAATVTPGADAQEKPLRAVIDEEMRKVWAREKVTPAGRCDDATFLRRVYLDLAGTVPAYEEAKQFLDDADPGKRGKLIDRLLDDPRYALHQANVWDQVFFGRNPANGEATRK